MDNQLRRDFLKIAQEGDHLRRLKRLEEWPKVIEIIHSLKASYDTVRGVRTDKEFLIRNSKVDVLDELEGIFDSVASEAENAMNELTTENEDEV